MLPILNDFHVLGRNGQALDVIPATFFAGAQADWTTGTVLQVDGGVTAGRHER